MADTSNSYSTKDYYDFLYFNDTLNNYIVSNVIMPEIQTSGQKFSALTGLSWPHLPYNTGTDTAPQPTIYFPTGIKVSRYGYYSSDSNFVVTPATNILKYRLNTSEYYRFEISNGFSKIVNVSYDISYLQDPSTVKPLIKDKLDKISQSVWSITTPGTFLEMCTSQMNEFFYNIMSMTRGTIYDANMLCDSLNITSACKLQTKNHRCACEASYTNHSPESIEIAKLMKNYDQLVTTDPWCVYADCASGMAYKNRATQRRSVCSNLSIAGVFADPGEYSNVNLNNVNVYATSQNDTGINLYGPCATKCGDGYRCMPDPKTGSYGCVKVNNKSLDESADIVHGQRNLGGGNTSSRVIISMIIVLIIAIIGFVICRVQNNHSKRTGMIAGMLILGISIVCVIGYILIYNQIEKFDSCVKDSDCSDKGDNWLCSYNMCTCKIGYTLNNSTLKCEINQDFVCNTLPYLPENYYSGIYYYSTYINNSIYVFAVDGSFKYDGEKWIEITPLPSQKGFHPYVPIIPLSADNSNSIYAVNNKMVCTFNNKIYVLSADYAIFNYSNTKTKTLTVQCYDIINNTWNELSDPKYGMFIGDGSINGVSNIVTIIVNNILYIFGGYRITDTTHTKNASIIMFNLSTSKIVSDTVTNPFSITASSQFFTVNDKTYLIGAQDSKNPTGFTMYEVTFNGLSAPTYKVIVGEGSIPVARDIYSGGPLGIYIGNNQMAYLYTPKKICICNTSTGKFTLGTITINDAQFKPTLFALPPYGTAWNTLYTFPAVTCGFYLNGFIFVITGGGNIFRIYLPEIKDNFICNMVPCLGIAKYGEPLKNKTIQL